MKRFALGLIPILVFAVVTTGTAAGGDLTGPITGGKNGHPFCDPVDDVASHGYVVEEYFMEGNASAYTFADSASKTPDGKWDTQRREETEPFLTRLLIVRPATNENFNGTVIVHWQNVTAGYELGTVTEGEYLRGYAWVGVSAQKIGVHGFPGPDAAGLRQWDEERYGALEHPGDAYSYDIFTQAAQAVGPDRPTEPIDPMGGLKVERLVAAGASQSAGRLRTYINGVHPIEKVFDGFIPYIDFGSTIPFDSDFGQRRRQQRGSTNIREDLDVPVLVVNTETETVAYTGARQPDTDRFRFWEVAGTSHVSAPRGEAMPGLNAPNWHSYQPVYSAALRHMHRWIKDGVEPPAMPRITVTEGQPRPTITRDERGNAVGGIRLPEFAVPTAKHSGMGKPVAGGNRFAFLYGSAEDFSDETLADLYPSQDAYMAKYDAALKQSVDQGMILAEDAPKLREAALAWAAKLNTE